MTKKLLINLDASNVFNPAWAKFGDLAPYHVQLGPDIEPIIKAALVQSKAVAISGQIGGGKSSALEYVCTQIPNLAVIWVPAREQAIEVLKDPNKFAAYLVQVIGDFAKQRDVISDQDFKQALEAAGANIVRTPQTVTKTGNIGVNKWLTVGLQREVIRVLDDEAVDLDRPTEHIYGVVSRILDTIRSYPFHPSLIPCLVIDDQDHWFARGTEEAGVAHAAFFGRIIPQLAKLNSALAIAIHTIYTNDPSLQGFHQVPIPVRLDNKKLVEIVEKRLEVQCQRRTSANKIFDEGTLELLCDFYQKLDAPNLREFLLACGYALETATRDRTPRITLDAAKRGVELQQATRLARSLAPPKSLLTLPPGNPN